MAQSCQGRKLEQVQSPDRGERREEEGLSQYLLVRQVQQCPRQEQVVGEVPCSHSIGEWPGGVILRDGAIGLGLFSSGYHN